MWRLGGRGRAAAALVTVLVLGVGAVVVALNLHKASPAAPVRCAATLDGTAWYLSPEQADSAALISAISVRRTLPARAATIAIATALRESRLSNISHGDRDSVGLFQQRPSQGWGSREQILDPVYSTNAFYDALIKIAGYQALPITDAAQRVQRSGFPQAYAQHETQARSWASALAGYSPAALTCTLGAGPKGTTDARREAFRARVQRDWGDLPLQRDTSGWSTDVTQVAWAAPDPARGSWAFADWTVAVAEANGVTAVAVADRQWSRANGTWSTVHPGASLPPGTIRVTLG
jgi:hypothetical protein